MPATNGCRTQAEGYNRAAPMRSVVIPRQLPALLVTVFLSMACRLAAPPTPTPSVVVSIGPPTTAVDAPAETLALQTLLNELRRARELPLLEFPASLQQIALARALEVAGSNDLRHAAEGSGNPTLVTALQQAGYHGRASEHLLIVTDPAEGLAATVMRAWISDSAHRADLLDPEFLVSGVGIVAHLDGWVVVQVLVENEAPEEAGS
ncbi:MAG TPA: CAP domain-containing protein [Anaerolineales bacterium]|nr:CAP domain-containing protein [Anaerolineales bacterium]